MVRGKYRISVFRGHRWRFQLPHSASPAVLELLEPLLLVFLGRVVEVEGVPPSRALPDPKVSRHVVGPLVLDVVEPLDLEEGHEREDLEEGEAGHLAEGGEGVGVAVGVEAGPIVSGEGAEKLGAEETKDGNLGDASVDQLGVGGGARSEGTRGKAASVRIL